MPVVQIIIDDSTSKVITGTFEFDRANGGTLMVPAGSAFPTTPAAKELFWRTDEKKLYRRNDGNTAWDAVEAAVSAHAIGGSDHTASTLANLNTKISDATLDDSGDPRDPNAHALGGSAHSADTLANLNTKVSDATLDDSSASRPPTSHATSHNAGGGDALAIDAAAGTGSFRTVGTGALQACAGNDSRLSDDRTADGLRTATTVVSVASATAPTSGQVLTASSGTVATWITPSGTGDVVGPASATDNALTRFDGTTGKLIQNSGITIDDSDNVSGAGTINGVSITAHAARHNAGGADALAIDAAAGTGSLRTVGTGALQACAGNDSRLSDDRDPTAHAASHNAGGSDALAIDAAAGTGSFRTIGTGALQACAGNDSRLSDDRDPTAHAASHNAGGADALAIDAAAGTGSFRTIGTGALQACAGNDSRLSDDRTADGLRTATTVVSVSSATAPTIGQVLTATSGTAATWQDVTGTGDVVGPASSVDNNLVRFDSTTGKLIQGGTNAPWYDDTGNLALRVGNELRFWDVGSSNYVGFEAPALTANQIWVLPDADGTSGQVLTTDGNGVLDFTTAAGGGTGGSIFGIWAEETAALVSGDYQWSFGNGDLTLDGSGIVVPFDCEVFAMALDHCTAGSATVRFKINTTNGGSVSTSSERSAYATFGTPYQVSAGDVLNFQTVTGTGSASGNRVVLWCRATTGNLITVRKNSGADVGTRPRLNFIEGTGITLTVADDGTNDEVDITITATGGGSGDVVGPASATDNAIARFDTTTGKLIQNSGVTIDDSDNISGVRTVQLDLLSPGSVSYSEGLIFYDQDAHALVAYNDQSSVTQQLGQELILRVYNDTGSLISDGSAVYISGASGGLPTVALAQADAVATAYAIGLATHDIANASEGFVAVFGGITVDTSGFSAGDVVYVSPTTPGALTSTVPVGSSIRVSVGTVSLSASSGRILVNSSGLPLDSNKSLTLPGDFYVSTDGASLASPRIIGAANMSAGEGARYQFGDSHNGWQNGYNQAMQLWAYHTIILEGDRAGDAPTMETTSDIGVLVRNTTAGSEALVVRGASGQTAPLTEWRNSADTVLVDIQADGDVDLHNHDIDNAKTVTFNSVQSHGSMGATETINWTLGQKHSGTNSANCTLSFTAPAGPCNVILVLTNGGAFTLTWPASVDWAGGTEPSWTTSGTDIVAFFYDGTTYYGVASLNFS